MYAFIDIPFPPFLAKLYFSKQIQAEPGQQSGGYPKNRT